MTKRRIKQHPSLDPAKPSLIEREAYLQELARLQKALQPSKQYQDAMQKALQPSKQYQDLMKHYQDAMKKALQPSKQYMKELENAKRIQRVFEKHGK